MRRLTTRQDEIALVDVVVGPVRAAIAKDDITGSADSRLDVTLPKSGTYFVGVIDANDQNGPTHVYRLSVRLTKP